MHIISRAGISSNFVWESRGGLRFSSACRAVARSAHFLAFVSGPLTLSLQRGSPTLASLRAKAGGRGGIRTHVRIAPKPDFESGAFNHSATLPLVLILLTIAA